MYELPHELPSDLRLRKLGNFKEIPKCQCCPHIETSQLICFANQLTGFYMRATPAFNGLMPCTQLAMRYEDFDTYSRKIFKISKKFAYNIWPNILSKIVIVMKFNTIHLKILFNHQIRNTTEGRGSTHCHLSVYIWPE